MAVLTFIDGKLALKCEYAEKELAKSIGGHRWNAEWKMWMYPVQEIVVEQIQTVFPSIKITKEVNGALEEHRLKQRRLIGSKLMECETSLPLRDYQKTGLNFLVNAKRAILGDDPGLGKTLQSIAACEHIEAKKVLVVCPNPLKWVWEEQIKQWVGKTSTVINGTKKQRDAAIAGYRGGYMIINYEGARIHPELQKMQWDALVCDEAHKLKNRKAAQTKSVKKIKAENVYLVTGTPMMNRTEELWSLLNILFPKQYTSFWRFADHYCEVRKNHFGTEILTGSDKQVEDLKKALEPVMIRRRKNDVLKELPPKIYQKYPVNLEGKQLLMYKQMEKDAIAIFNDGDVIAAPVVIAQITRLRQIAISTELLGEEQATSAKFEALTGIIEENIEDRKIVVFSQFRRAIELYGEILTKKGIKWVAVTGKQNNDQKIAATQQFQEDKETRVMLSTIQAGGLGLTWTAAEMVIFLDKHWTPATNMQAEDRLHRIGQKSSVQVISLVAKDTVEDWIESLLESKQDIFDRVIEGKSLVRMIGDYMCLGNKDCSEVEMIEKIQNRKS